MATEMEGQLAPLVILIAIVIGVILFAISVPPAERERAIGPIYYERAALDAQPGLVKANPSTLLVAKHDFGPVVVDFSPVPSATLLSDRVKVSRSAVSDNSASFKAVLDKGDLTEAQLVFEVTNKQGEIRELMVMLNGILVFNGILPLGKASVALPLDNLQDGTNTITISVAPPGAKFWLSSSYELSNVNLATKSFVEEQASRQQVLTLGQQEIDGLVSAKYEALVSQLSDAPATLSFSVNGRKVFEEEPIGSRSVAIELPQGLLEPSNALKWSVGKGGAYEILFGRISTEYSKSKFEPKSYTFAILEAEKSSIDSGQYNCLLEINATSAVTQPVTVRINSEKLIYKLSSGSLSENVCPYLFAGTNYIAVYSEKDLNLESLKLRIRGKV